MHKKQVSGEMSFTPSIESEVLAAERRWVQAHRDLDLDVIADMLAEEYKKIEPDGTVIDKQQALISYATRTRGWDVAESDQLELQVHGDVAILIGRWTGRGENRGERFDYQARFASIYLKQSAGWKLAFDQSTPINKIK